MPKVPALVYGREKEDLARKAIEDEFATPIQKCGLFIHAEIPYLGATPDGLIDEDTIVEIKCPYSARNLTPEEAIAENIGNLRKIFHKDDPDHLNPQHEYFYQVQGQLHITGRKYCVFCLWTNKGMKYTVVFKDDLFWSQNMESQLKRFYMDCMLPEIIDPRYSRSMPIRDPEYILEARRALELKKQLKKQ